MKRTNEYLKAPFKKKRKQETNLRARDRNLSVGFLLIQSSKGRETTDHRSHATGERDQVAWAANKEPSPSETSLEWDGPGKEAFDDRRRLRVAAAVSSSEPGLNKIGDNLSSEAPSSSESRIEIKGGLSEARLLDAEPEARNDDLLTNCLTKRSEN